MNKPLFHPFRACVAGLLVVAAAGISGCTSRGTIGGPTVTDETTVTPALKNLLATSSRPSVVLRVPASSGESSIVQTESGFANSIYNTIEQELAKAGFIVRDRQMLRTILGRTTEIHAPISYEEMGRRLQADIIIEISSFKKSDFWHKKFTDNKGNVHECTLPNGLVQKWLNTPFYTLAGKIVITSEGAIGGFFSFNHGSSGGEFLVKPKGSVQKYRFKFINPISKQINKQWWQGISYPLPNNVVSAKHFAQKMIELFTNPNAAANAAR